MKTKKSLFLSLIMLHAFSFFCYGQNNTSIIGNWYYTIEMESPLFKAKIISTSYLTFSDDQTFVKYLHSIVIGGESDGLEGTDEVIIGRYSVLGNRLTLYFYDYNFGKTTDSCIINITNDILELTGFTHHIIKRWIGSENGINWSRQ